MTSIPTGPRPTHVHHPSRRTFVKIGAATAAGLALAPWGCAPAAESGPKPLRILVLGGTGFIGPHMVRRARERGHTLTLFNRGRSNSDLFPDIETLIGDRDGQLDALKGHEWDAVIDNSGYVPRHVRDSAQLLAGSARQYLFISSVSAYASLANPGITEESPLGTMPDPTVEEVTGETYGPMKVLAEQEVQKAFPNGTTIVRPGYIVGPGDSTDRWTYWPVRVAAGGEVLAPGDPAAPIQVIDARDLAAFAVHLLEQGTTGAFNAVGPAAPLPMSQMLDTLKSVSGSDASFTWVDQDFLVERGAQFPIWSPTTGAYGGVHTVKTDHSIAAGLTHRPLAETTADTLAWWNGLDAERRAAMRSGLRLPPELGPQPASLEAQREVEKKLLEAWKRRSA
ncbi:MAG: NAD-dependent epimerase/dehydratase family protein [Gemmatimonadales bacterium]